MIAREKPARARKGAATTGKTAAETLSALGANRQAGLSGAEVRVRREQNGLNDGNEKQAHPLAMFVRRFWGL